MSSKLRWVYIFSVSVLIAALISALTLRCQKVSVIATHQCYNRSDILVDRLPWSDKGKIKWWQNNKTFFQERYDIPKPDITGGYSIAIWRFGDGYKALEKYDRLCFEDMPPPNNCIEKDRLMYITLTRNGEVSYWLNDTRYIQRKSGELVEVGFD